MKVHFITHSCFLIESESCYVLFDYFKGELPKVKKDKPLFSFSSHSHSDHFSVSVFDLVNQFDTIHFILSDDIFKKRVPEQILSQTTFVLPSNEYELLGIKIKTLKSTDKGVAFAIHVDGKDIFHAADLNDWAWSESSQSENEKMHKDYLHELKQIADKDFCLSFVPLDPRQEEYFDLGMLGFLQHIYSQYVFPMHMWNDFSYIKKFKEKYPMYSQKIMSMSTDNQSFEI